MKKTGNRIAKRTGKIGRFGLCALIILLLVFGIAGCRFSEGNKNTNEDKGMNEVVNAEDMHKEEVGETVLTEAPEGENRDSGDIQSIIEYGSNILVAAHYPTYGKDNIDTISKDFITKYIENLKRELAEDPYYDEDFDYELNIDFKTYNAPNNLVSVIFNITENSSSLAHPIVEVETKVYDLSNDLEIELSDIMDGDYLVHISQLCENYFRTDDYYKDNIDLSIFEEGIYPSEENYRNFLFQEDRLVIVFDKYQLFSGNFGMPSVELAYTELADYIKPELQKFFIPEEGLLAEEEVIEEPITDIIFPKREIDSAKPMIALTFDDGPNKETTGPILDILREYNSVATFFVLGNRVSIYADFLRQMLEEGNEIGNHSYNHKELTKLSLPELKEQIMDTQEAVITHTGYEPKLMRPTYGSYNDKVKSEIDMPLILWSIDTLDWKSRDANKVADHVLANVKDGDIILMHDIFASTAEATQLLVPKLIDMGFQLVTVSELYESKGEKLESGNAYHSPRK